MKRRQFIQYAAGIALTATAAAAGPPDEKPVLHVFLAVDLSEPHRKTDRTHDLNTMGGFLKKMGELAGMQVRVRSFVNADFTPGRLMDSIREIGSLQGTRNGLIVYFSGHGGNWGDDRWPHLMFGRQDFAMSRILTAVNDIRPKIGLVIGDCCNNAVTVNEGLAQTLPPLDAAIARKLFWNFGKKNERLSLKASAASPGQYSYSQPLGSVYRQCFVKAFTEQVEVGSPTAQRSSGEIWDAIFQRATELTQKQLQRIESKGTLANPLRQTPAHKVQLVTCPDGFEDC